MDIENRLVIAKEEEVGEGMEWEVRLADVAFIYRRDKQQGLTV